MSSTTLDRSRHGRRTWASDRLLLGQSNVGAWVLLAGATIAVQPELSSAGLGQDLLLWAAIVAVATGLQAPFDLIGGYVLPVAHERRDPGFAQWFGEWSRGVLIHASAFALIGAAVLVVGSGLGPWAAVGVSVATGGALVALQGRIATWLSRAELTRVSGSVAAVLTFAGIDPERVRMMEVGDAGFVGGWVGPRGLETLILPARWARELTPAMLEVVLWRRSHALASGSRAVGVLGALAFNAIGLAVVLTMVPGAGVSSAAGLLLTSAGCTLWSFLGLLMLPTASRSAVTWLDRQVSDRLGDRRAVAQTIRHLDRAQEDELHRSDWIEAIFHPVPTPTSRAVALLRPPGSGPVPWRVARMALFTSWAQLSWLARAVHCNAGRPDLWAILPGD